MRRDRRRADIDRHAVGLVAEARPHRDDGAVVMDRHGDLPFALAQGSLQGLHDMEIAGEARELPLSLQRLVEPLQIARRRVHVGLGDLDIIEADRRIELDRHRLDRLAHDLAMDLARLRHVDDDVAEDRRRAGEAPPLVQPLALAVASLDLGEGAEMRCARHDAVLRELALGEVHLAAPADAAPAAHGIDVDAERARRLQHGRAVRKPAAPPRGREDDECVVSHADACPRADRAPPRHRCRAPAPRGTCAASACRRDRGPSSRRRPSPPS